MYQTYSFRATMSQKSFYMLSAVLVGRICISELIGSMEPTEPILTGLPTIFLAMKFFRTLSFGECTSHYTKTG